MTFVVALTQGEPAQRDSLVAAIRGLESDDAVVVDGDGNRGVVYLEIRSCSDIDAAARRAIEIVAVAGVAANTTFRVETGDLSWPPLRGHDAASRLDSRQAAREVLDGPWARSLA
jgi:hypothetical protein